MRPVEYNMKGEKYIRKEIEYNINSIDNNLKWIKSIF